MKDRKKPEKFWLPHGMPSDDREFAFSSRVFPKAAQIKAPYKLWHYQFTTKDVGEGTGLGLSIVHGIVMNHGGAITVQSQPEQGTAFSIYMPHLDEDSTADDEPERVAVP